MKVYSTGECELKKDLIYRFSKKLGFLTAAKCCGFETVNFIQIGLLLASLWRRHQK